MEHWKKKLGAICLMLFLLVPGTATAVVIPKDLPTIEALIALHKCIKKDEDQALGRVATSFGEQSLVTKGANKFNEVRTTLNTKMSNALCFAIDPEGWANVMTMRNQVDGLVSDWNGLVAAN